MTISGKQQQADDSFDVIILGAGPAGISCALELRENKIEALIIERKDRCGGQLAEIPSALINLPWGHFPNGPALQDVLNAQASAAGLNILFNETVESCNLRERTLTTKNRTFTARALFLATGYHLKRLPERFNSFSKDIFYRTGTSQADFLNKRVVVIGGGDSAFYEALERKKTASSVTIVHRSAKFRARPDLRKEAEEKGVEVLENFAIESLHGNGSLEQVELQSTVDDTVKTIPAEKLVAKIGYAPNTEIFAGQIDMDSSGHIKVDPDCSTKLDGVFAGGDIARPGLDRIAAAMGQGTVAADTIRAYLYRQKEERQK